MRRGTTSTVTLDVDIDLTAYAEIWVTFEDRRGTEVTKTKTDMTVAADKLVIDMTQEDTLALGTGRVKLQVRALDIGGGAIASDIIDIPDVTAILKEGAISAS